MIAARMLLRTETGPLHAMLDGLLARTDFDDVASYADFLTRQAGPLFAAEAAISESPLAIHLADWPQRRRSDAIRSDLTALDAPIPSPALFPALTNEDAALGALYVLEGSRLGAKYLVKSAHQSRSGRVRAATAFLAHGDGEPFWPTYLQKLAAREAEQLDGVALVAGARTAFEAFIASAAAELGPVMAESYSTRVTST